MTHIAKPLFVIRSNEEVLVDRGIKFELATNKLGTRAPFRTSYCWLIEILEQPTTEPDKPRFSIPFSMYQLFPCHFYIAEYWFHKVQQVNLHKFHSSHEISAISSLLVLSSTLASFVFSVWFVCYWKNIGWCGYILQTTTCPPSILSLFCMLKAVKGRVT